MTAIATEQEIQTLHVEKEVQIAAPIGVVFETLLAASGWVRAESNLVNAAGFAPLWMVALWACFATTLNVSLRALRRKYLLVSVLAKTIDVEPAFDPYIEHGAGGE